MDIYLNQKEVFLDSVESELWLQLFGSITRTNERRRISKPKLSVFKINRLTVNVNGQGFFFIQPGYIHFIKCKQR